MTLSSSSLRATSMPRASSTSSAASGARFRAGTDPASGTPGGRPLFPKLTFAPVSDFAKTLQTELKQLMRESGDHRFATARQWLHTGLAAGISAACYSALLAGVGAGSLVLSGLLTAGAGFFAFMLIVLMGHDAAHASVSRHRWVNNTALFWIFAVMGISGALWRDRHIRLHHAYPNLPGTGIDADSSGAIRLAPDKPRRWFHAFQGTYGVLLYAIGMISLVWFEDFRNFVIMRQERPRNFAGAWQMALFIAAKLVHVVLFIGLPALAGGFGALELAGGYLLATAVISLSFATLVIGTHVSDRAEFPLPDAQGRVPHDWATHQVVTSVDWAPLSRVWAMVTGGANAHTAHHLFPGYSHRHSVALSRIVIDAARRHGLNYKATSFAGLVGSHLQHMRNLGRRDAERGEQQAA